METMSLVCPARAGMIRARIACSGVRRGLPRTCGDDPKQSAGKYTSYGFAPHVRG